MAVTPSTRSAPSARGEVVQVDVLSFLMAGPRPHGSSHPSCQGRMLNSLLEVLSGPRRAFQLSVSSGTTRLKEGEASLCHQKAAAACHSLSNSAQDRREIQLQTGLAKLCGAEGAWPSQHRAFREGFYRGQAWHPPGPSAIWTPSLIHVRT